jgi:1-acyl-sn-glycerol-3-phosphate acyltransferase
MSMTNAPADRARAAHAVAGPLRSAARGAAMIAWSASMTQAALLRLRLCAPARRAEVAERWVQGWAQGLLVLFGVRQRWSGAPPARANGARLVVANHRSPIDILLMLQHFGGSVLARHDLSSWPVMGRAAREGGTIFVDRSDPHSGVKAIREIRRRLRDGKTVIVFPEGTTHEGDEVRPFLGGAFAAVRGLPAEVVPVGIAYEPGAEFVDEGFVAHLRRVAQRPATRVALCVGEALPAAGDRTTLAADMRKAVQDLVARARGELG